MQKTAKRSLLKKATQAGALLGAMGLWCATPVWAQGFVGQTSQSNPPAIQRVSSQEAPLGRVSPLNYQDPAPVVPPAPPESPLAPPPVGVAEAPVAAEPPAEEAPPVDDMWHLQSLFNGSCAGNWMTNNRITIGGYTVQSYTINFQHPSDHFNGVVTWTDRSNEYQLNEQWFFTERATDTSKGCDWDIGYRADAFYGSSARLDTSAGFDDRYVRYHSFYGFAVPNLYVETAYKKLKVKYGKFVSPVGYFTVNTALNFFNTIPYTYQYGEPFTHTGSCATYNVTDEFIVGGGVIRGWDNTGDQNHNMGFLGTYSYTFKDKSNIAMVQVLSQEPGSTDKDGSSFRYFQTLVYTKQLSEKWNYVGQSDYGHQKHTATVSGSAQWYGLNQYLYYTQNQCLTWGINGEWFRDQDGFRVGGFLPTLTAGPYNATNSQSRGLPLTRSGYQGNFFQMTVGPRWTPNKNLTIRPNFRYDVFQGKIRTDGFSANPGNLRPFNDGQSNHQGILATDVIFSY